jgi:hypothetical protein
MAAKGSLVSFAIDAVTSYRLRAVKGGTTLGHVLNQFGEGNLSTRLNRDREEDAGRYRCAGHCRFSVRLVGLVMWV